MDLIGYSYLIQHFDLQVCELGRSSYLWDKSQKKEESHGIGVKSYYPSSYLKNLKTWVDHLRFAFKHEGLNLEVLSALFRCVSREDVRAVVAARTTGGFCRRLWFCYEFLTGDVLPIGDLKNINYIPLVDEKRQIVRPEKVSTWERRYKIVNNLLGNRAFCPMLYRVPDFVSSPGKSLKELADAIRADYSDELQYRAIRYLFIKETKSSFAIERETPDQRRMERFVALLQNIPVDRPLTQEQLLEWQAQIVDARYHNESWRKDQVYVGQTLAPGRERVHFIAPRAVDLDDVMKGWLACAENLLSSEFDAVLATAVLSFAFVFLHPFDDGNGRIHRLLMHYCLTRRQFTLPGSILPISASLLRNPHLYDSMLESFSRRVMPLIRYEIDDQGEVTVVNETIDHYRYMDLTYIAERFISVLREVLENDWRAELDYLQEYDQIRKRMRAVVDLPEKKAIQFVTFVQQNKGRLSKSKRMLFAELTDGEVRALEKAVSPNGVMNEAKACDD